VVDTNLTGYDQSVQPKGGAYILSRKEKQREGFPLAQEKKSENADESGRSSPGGNGKAHKTDREESLLEGEGSSMIARRGWGNDTLFRNRCLLKASKSKRSKKAAVPNQGGGTWAGRIKRQGRNLLSLTWTSRLGEPWPGKENSISNIRSISSKNGVQTQGKRV